jgi:hypothetical protein
MEEWERELRERLDKEVLDGPYQIGAGAWVVWTGKLGYINYLVELHREVKANRTDLEQQVENGKQDYHVLDSKKLEEFINSLNKKGGRE